jgi:hypothetical protein
MLAIERAIEASRNVTTGISGVSYPTITGIKQTHYLVNNPNVPQSV